MDYSVDYALLTKSAGKAKALTADISSTMQDMRLDDVPAAIPGSRSAGAASSLDGEWQSSSKRLEELCQRHAETLAQTADAYRQVEDKAQSHSDQFFSSIGGR